MKKEKLNKRNNKKDDKKLIGNIKIYLLRDMQMQVSGKILTEFDGKNVQKIIRDLGNEIANNVIKYFEDEYEDSEDEKDVDIKVIKAKSKESQIKIQSIFKPPETL